MHTCVYQNSVCACRLGKTNQAFLLCQCLLVCKSHNGMFSSLLFHFAIISLGRVMFGAIKKIHVSPNDYLISDTVRFCTQQGYTFLCLSPAWLCLLLTLVSGAHLEGNFFHMPRALFPQYRSEPAWNELASSKEAKLIFLLNPEKWLEKRKGWFIYWLSWML